MALIQLSLKNNQNTKIKDLFLEINRNTKFSDLIDKASSIIGNQYNIDSTKIIIDNNIYLDYLNESVLAFLQSNNIDYEDLDDLEFVLFINMQLPKLLSHSLISTILKKHI
jgi:hypothetical protein